MCGIAAVFALKGSCDCLSHARAMTQVIRHRGPDDEGYAAFPGDSSVIVLGGPDTPQEAYRSSYLYAPDERPTEEKPRGAYAALGHRRLSIIDLSPSGHQPMCSSDGRYWITYNGEVYNFPELREQLSRLGRSFRGRSDTEVVLQAYDAWGMHGLKRLEGVFAFALWDGARKRLVLMRDRLGVKPLFYAWGDGRLVFGSEITSVMAAGGIDTTIDEQAFSEYLWYGNAFEDRTLYRAVRSLPPGHWMIVEDGRVRTEAWWRVEEWLGQADRPATEPEAVIELRLALSAAVRRQLISDVPVGIFLSGGLDSSSIAYTAVRDAGQTLSSFSGAGMIVDAVREDHGGGHQPNVAERLVEIARSSGSHADAVAAVQRALDELLK